MSEECVVICGWERMSPATRAEMLELVRQARAGELDESSEVLAALDRRLDRQRFEMQRLSAAQQHEGERR